jgi:negative regulator of flagellin synthesis FlgM
VSPETLQLRRAATQLASAPDVDAEKIAEIRQAIADGRLPLDLDALSKAVLDLHRP